MPGMVDPNAWNNRSECLLSPKNNHQYGGTTTFFYSILGAKTVFSGN